MEYKLKYTPRTGSDNKWYPHGPGKGLDYYGGFLYSNIRWNTEEEVVPICEIADSAYNAGYQQAQYDIKKALGIKEE